MTCASASCCLNKSYLSCSCFTSDKRNRL